MRNLILGFGLFAISGVASAQWAVLDEKVRLLVENIKFVAGEGTTLSSFDPQSELNAKFEAISVAKPDDYIGTVADCGDEKINKNHYNACLGLRNLRLKTLEQTQALVKKMQDRRGEIKTTIDSGTGAKNAGELQHQQFVLQGLQAHMQNDAMELEALRYGYQQRAIIYETQMAEARRATDTRAPAGPGGFKITLPVPFPGK